MIYRYEMNNMSIIINIDVMLAKSKMGITELSERIGITMANLSILKNRKTKAIRLSNLKAICKALEYQPEDILEYRNNIIEKDYLKMDSEKKILKIK